MMAAGSSSTVPFAREFGRDGAAVIDDKAGARVPPDGLGDAPIALCPGRTTHTRFAPRRHTLAYRTLSILVDVDRLDEADGVCGAFSVERFNLFSFCRRDVGPRCDLEHGGDLRVWAEGIFAQADVVLDGGRVTLLCFPRVLGYVFNPLSMWFGYGPDGGLRGVIYEVHNTFGDAHTYVARVANGSPDRGALKQCTAKTFHVSPFFPDHGQYAFTLRAPAARYALTIDYHLEGAHVLQASHVAQPQPLTTGSAWRAFFSQPLATHKAIAGIHWEALLLFLKGARYHRRPEPPDHATVVEALGVGPTDVFERETRARVEV